MLYFLFVGISALYFNRPMGDGPLSRLNGFFRVSLYSYRAFSNAAGKVGGKDNKKRLYDIDLCRHFYDFVLGL